jgi:DNA-binding CsgD family transcriptional regulator
MASRSAADPRRADRMLADVFGLTRAESRAAASLAAGLTPAEIAERHRITVQTVRKQLKAVYSKMGIRRQSELSSMLARLQAILPPSGLPHS